MYDPRLGRWFAVDPLAKKYPAISGYAFSLNSPLQFIDPNGKDPITPKEMRIALNVYMQVFFITNKNRALNQFNEDHGIIVTETTLFSSEPDDDNASVRMEGLRKYKSPKYGMSTLDKNTLFGSFILKINDTKIKASVSVILNFTNVNRVYNYKLYDKPQGAYFYINDSYVMNFFGEGYNTSERGIGSIDFLSTNKDAKKINDEMKLVTEIIYKKAYYELAIERDKINKIKYSSKKSIQRQIDEKDSKIKKANPNYLTYQEAMNLQVEVSIQIDNNNNVDMTIQYTPIKSKK